MIYFQQKALILNFINFTHCSKLQEKKVLKIYKFFLHFRYLVIIKIKEYVLFKIFRDSYSYTAIKKQKQGIPWRSSQWDSALSLPRARVQFLVGELRSCKPHSTAKKKKKTQKNKNRHASLLAILTHFV